MKMLILFFKSNIANRPGLVQRSITHKDGRTVKHWVRTGEEDTFGSHNTYHGDRVHYPGGAGEVVARGSSGVTVKHEASGSEHRVGWNDVHSIEQGGGGAVAPRPSSQQMSRENETTSPESFKASDYFAQHNDVNVTPEEILKHFPPDTKSKMEHVEKKVSAAGQTIDRYRNQDGSYAGFRGKKVHQAIINHFLSPEKIAAATPKEGGRPVFMILGGRGGSGKSWFKGKVYDPQTAIVLDADEIKGMLPEYAGWNAAQVHEESGDLFDRITMEAARLGLNIVHDATMKTAKKAVDLVKQFKDKGYSVEAHYMHLPRQEAAKRAVGRFLHGGVTGRYVPPAVVLGNTGNEASFDQVKPLCDAWSFRDNNVEKGQEPKLISEMRRMLKAMARVFGGILRGVRKGRAMKTIEEKVAKTEPKSGWLNDPEKWEMDCRPLREYNDKENSYWNSVLPEHLRS